MPDMSRETRTLIQEANTRNEYACQIIAGFRSAMPTLADVWDDLQDALNDVLILNALLSRLSSELDQARLQRANLIAAMRATLAADVEDEPDPLWYVRDELEALSDAPETLPDASWRRG